MLVHIIFATKNRDQVLLDSARTELFAYILGLCRNKDCFPYQIGGYREHLHLLVDLHPSIALADFVRIVKTSSSAWMKENGKFPRFRHWQDGYAAFTVDWDDRERVIHYIANQDEHHREVSFLDEFKQLMATMGVEIDERYLP